MLAAALSPTIDVTAQSARLRPDISIGVARTNAKVTVTRGGDL